MRIFFLLFYLNLGFGFQALGQSFHYRDAYQVLLAENFTFHRLQKMFASGQPLDGHEFVGPKVGLVFYFNEPSQATSTGMLIEESEPSQEISVYEGSYGDGRAFFQDDDTINTQIFSQLDLHDCFKTESDNPLLISIIPDFCRRTVNNHPDYAVEYRTSGSFVIAALRQKSDALVELRESSKARVPISRDQIWGYSVYLAPLSY